MLGGADNPNGELLSYIIGADNADGVYTVVLFITGLLPHKKGLLPV